MGWFIVGNWGNLKFLDEKKNDSLEDFDLSLG